MKRSTKPVPVNNQDAREGEGVLLIVQNNLNQTLTIADLNEAAAEKLGFRPEELKGRRLEVVLGAKTAEYIADEIEFADDAPDLEEVLARQRVIRLRNQAGEEWQAACTISRVIAAEGHARFQLMIQNDREQLAQQKVKDFIALTLAGRQQLDEKTNLPDRATAAEFLPLLKNFLAESEIQAAFAVLRVDRFEKSVARYGRDGAITQLQHAAHCCRTTFRGDDLIFNLSDSSIGLVLFDISRESARVVLSRLRWGVRSNRINFGGKNDFAITVSVWFDMLDDRTDSLLTRCEDAVKALGEDERNQLIELAP